jgi:ActR/RegA family two-component response regulator
MTWSDASAGTRPRVLCVDDEPNVLEGLRDTLRRSFEVAVATDPVVGLEILRQDPAGYAVVISDMRMPRMSGADFLREARVIAPDTVRMLLTGYADLEAAIKAVNGARLFRYLNKPCDSSELLRACAAALGQYRLQTAERELLEQTVRGCVDALVEVLALTNPAAFGRAARIATHARKLAGAAALPNAWEVEVAAMLADLGAVTLPQATAEKLYAGGALTVDEAEMVRRVPEITRGLLSKIPRLEGVLEIFDSYPTALPAEAEGASPEAPAGALALRIAADYDELEADGSSDEVALGVMRSRGIYDRRLLYAFTGVVNLAGGPPPVQEVTVDGLKIGDSLADDVRTVTGSLLVARGQQVTEQLLERLWNLSPASIREPLHVIRRGS